MISRDNFAIKLCGKLQTMDFRSTEVSAREWRLVGQEQDASQIFTWSSRLPNSNADITNIGSYSQESNSLQLLHSFEKTYNIIQASVNDSHTLLGFVIKESCMSSISFGQPTSVYRPYILQLKTKVKQEPRLIDKERGNQVMIQFLYKKDRAFIGKTLKDKFLMFAHLEYIKSYSVNLNRDGCDDFPENTWYMDSCLVPADIIVKSFSWAQWDPVNQVLYYIYYKVPIQSSIEGEECPNHCNIAPTLSGLQFHPDLPHETVLNIPLNLPQLPSSGEVSSCGLYEDDAVPLRVHDCSLDLQIVSNPSGIVCICHHYLYQPTDDQDDGTNTKQRHALKPEDNTEQKVHFAYSVTLLHHGYVTHCTIPKLPWPLAKSLRPTFLLYREDYLLVHLPMLYTHLLDIGLNHEPSCHIVLPPFVPSQGNVNNLVSLLGHGKHTMVDLVSLDIVKLNISNTQLISVFKTNTSVENKLAILHYFLHHDFRMEIVEELLCDICTSNKEAMGALCAVLKEFLIGGSYMATKTCLPTAALPLTRLLPFTTNLNPGDTKIGEITVSVSQEQLWNTAMMLLSPRQRIVPFRSDMWTRLYDYLSPVTIRFKSHQVLDKLRVSLACYQPEALSRCSTPLSPGGAPPSSRRSSHSSSLQSADHALLPFIELDTCTASKQEHIISVNLREVSMHLLKHGSPSGMSGVGAGGGGSGGSHVHSVATRYAAAQLETSRSLCLIVAKALGATAKPDQERGFTFIDSMKENHRYMLLKALESYYLAADSLAFPLPQGFSSFLTYLGYRSMSFSSFLQYVHRNVFEIQIDFLKVVISEAGDDNEAVLRGLRLAALGGRGRGRRALVGCSHSAAILLRARDHAATILAGHTAHLTRPAANARLSNTRKGLAAFPRADRLSPLDTFLDLLTAKASLNELDFNLLIDATILTETNN